MGPIIYMYTKERKTSQSWGKTKCGCVSHLLLYICLSCEPSSGSFQHPEKRKQKGKRVKGKVKDEIREPGKKRTKQKRSSS
jgi:hypothetical protein